MRNPSERVKPSKKNYGKRNFSFWYGLVIKDVRDITSGWFHFPIKHLQI